MMCAAQTKLIEQSRKNVWLSGAWP
jgi:hypothetical protein